MKKLQAKWSLESGDGTGCSIQDAMVRNEQGICSVLGCGKKIEDNAVSYGFMQKMCLEHEEEHKKMLESIFGEA